MLFKANEAIPKVVRPNVKEYPPGPFKRGI
jgi:hypothetical protein